MLGIWLRLKQGRGREHSIYISMLPVELYEKLCQSCLDPKKIMVVIEVIVLTVCYAAPHFSLCNPCLKRFYWVLIKQAKREFTADKMMHNILSFVVL